MEKKKWIKSNECMVKGCTNKKHEGNFVGDMCVPCYEMITTGEIKYGKTFIHDLRDKIVKHEELLSNLTDVLEEYTK